MKEKVVCWALLALLLSGCARFSAPVSPNQPLDAAKSFFYGRFHQSSRTNNLQFGLVVISRHRNPPCCIRFASGPKAVGAYSVEPGDYQISKLLFIDGDGYVQSELVLSYLISNRVFRAEQGQAYYLGDYYGEATSTFQWDAPEERWILRGICDNSSNTTADLESRYPQFKNVKKRDVMLDLLPEWMQQRCK